MLILPLSLSLITLLQSYSEKEQVREKERQNIQSEEERSMWKFTVGPKAYAECKTLPG